MLCTFYAFTCPKHVHYRSKPCITQTLSESRHHQTHLGQTNGSQGKERSKQCFCMACNKDPLLVLMLLPLTQFNVLKSISITPCQAPLQMVTWVCWGKSASGPSTRPTSQAKKLVPVVRATWTGNNTKSEVVTKKSSII